MGLRISKSKRNSYEIAPVVSNKDFTYKRHTRPQCEVELAEAMAGDQATDACAQQVTTTGLAASSKAADNRGNIEVRDERIPDWVNENTFKKLLTRTHPNIKHISAFHAQPAVAAGENYATLILRVQITATFDDDSSQDFSYMLKVAHNNKEMEDVLHTMNFFVTENSVYSEVIPELQEIYIESGSEIKFAAKAHRLDLEDANIQYVLLDDLSVEGYKNANRLECLNMEHTLCVLRKMAQFHAASACRVATKGSYSSVFTPDLDNEMVRATLHQMFSSFKAPFLNNLRTYDNGEEYVDAMQHFFDNLVEKFIHSRKWLPNLFNALSHGDLWCNNILFKYGAEGQLEDAIFVDFQNTNWSTPGLDLYYFIISSVQIDIKLSQFDYFICYYHEQLRQHLKMLQYPFEVPSLRDFHLQMFDCGHMATLTAFMTLGIVLLDPTNSAKFEHFMNDSEESNNFKNSMYTNERYRKHINEILPWLYNRGFMEINLGIH